MNNYIVGGLVAQPPQLRYTGDNQTPILEFQLRIPGLREEDPPSDMKVTIWGDRAQDAHTRIQGGQSIILKGRLSMKVVERPEGFKEKQAEMSAYEWWDSMDAATGSLTGWTPPATTAPPPAAQQTIPAAPAAAEPDYSDIPF